MHIHRLTTRRPQITEPDERVMFPELRGELSLAPMLRPADFRNPRRVDTRLKTEPHIMFYPAVPQGHRSESREVSDQTPVTKLLGGLWSPLQANLSQVRVPVEWLCPISEADRSGEHAIVLEMQDLVDLVQIEQTPGRADSGGESFTVRVMNDARPVENSFQPIPVDRFTRIVGADGL